jgi:hypothetical protein
MKAVNRLLWAPVNIVIAAVEARTPERYERRTLTVGVPVAAPCEISRRGATNTSDTMTFGPVPALPRGVE